MDDAELRDALENSGFTQYQSSAYLSLLELGAASAADIAEQSGVPGPRIYDVLRDLEAKGHVELYKQGQLHARIHDPSSVIDTFDTRISQFESAMGSIEQRWKRPDLENYAVSIVKRIETAIERTSVALERASNQVQLCVTEDQFERFRPQLKTAFSNGVFVKTCLFTEGPVDTREPFEGVCTEVRHREIPAPFLVLVDRDTVCFAPNELSTNEYGVIGNDPSHAYVFNVFFQTSLWNPWEVVYSDVSDELPLEFVDIRACIQEMAPLLQRGAEIHATVRGSDVETGAEIEIQGTIQDVHDDTRLRGAASTAVPNGIASLTVETAEGTFSAGDWGAMLEDIEATRVTINRIETSGE